MGNPKTGLRTGRKERKKTTPPKKEKSQSIVLPRGEAIIFADSIQEIIVKSVTLEEV